MEEERSFMEKLGEKLERVTEGSEQKEVMSLKARLTYRTTKKTSRAFSKYNQRK